MYEPDTASRNFLLARTIKRKKTKKKTKTNKQKGRGIGVASIFAPIAIDVIGKSIQQKKPIHKVLGSYFK